MMQEPQGEIQWFVVYRKSDYTIMIVLSDLVIADLNNKMSNTVYQHETLMLEIAITVMHLNSCGLVLGSAKYLQL